MEMKFGGDITKQVISEGTESVKDGIKGIEKNAKNMTIHVTPSLEIEAKDEEKGLNKILGSINDISSKIAKELDNKSKETDATISDFNKDLEEQQQKLNKVGAQANKITKKVKKIKSISKAEELIKSNTGYKSDKWKQDEEKIENSKNLNDDEKAQLKKLSKQQKQLNTLKERQLKTIQDIQEKESKTEEDISKQYETAVKLKKVLELMEANKKTISDVIGDKYSNNSITNSLTSKTSIPAKVEKYIESLNLKMKDEDEGDDGIEYLKKELKRLYTKNINNINAKKEEYIEDKEFQETEKFSAETVEKAKKQIPKLQEIISKHEQSLDNQIKNLEQDAIKSIEEYLKVADKDFDDITKNFETALKKVGTYLDSGGELDAINIGLENILKNNHELGGKNENGKLTFSDNLEDLKAILKNKDDFKKSADEYYDIGMIDKQVKIEMDKTIEATKKEIVALKKRKEYRENYIESVKHIGHLVSDNVQVDNTQTNTYTEEQAEIKNEIENREVPISVVPEIEPEKFVDEITQQLKGHSAKVDVELNSENVAEEIKKITEMIPDKKEIEVSIKSEQTDKKIDKNDSISDASVTSEIQKQNELQKELQETDEQVQRIMYHYGKLNRSLGGKESHQFGDEIAAYAEGKRNGNRGWADGTGTYVTNDATEFGFMQKDDLKKFFALDTSKLKLYEAHVEEEAQRFYEFQHKLEQFVLALGSGFTGFDDNISNINSETLYKEATSIFSKYSEIFNNVFKDFEEFDAFIDEMINLTSISGMNENGIEAKNAKKLLNFKKENGIDDIKTRFLKKLGFQGTDLSGTSYGGIQTGSVIFDIEEAPVIASGKTITEVLEQIGITAEDTKYKINEINSNEVPSFSQNNSVNELENDLKAIYQLIDKIELEDIIGENFNTVYAEKDLLNLISLLKEIDKLTGQTSDYSHLTEGYESKYFKPSYFSEFMDGVKPESDEWYDNESVIREAQQLSIMSTIGANDVADMYAALLDEGITPTIKSKVEEMFTLDPKALRKHFEDYGGIIRNAIGGDAYYNLEDRLYPDQSDNLNPQNNLENHSSAITENLKEQDAKINIAPNIENPQEFANDVTAQLKGVKAEINVEPIFETGTSNETIKTIANSQEKIQNEIDSSEVIRSQNELQNELEETNRAIKIQQEWLDSLYVLNKKFDTSNKQDATTQLREATKAYKEYYKERKKFDEDDSYYKQKMEVSWWKANEEAKNKGVAQSTLEKYNVNINEDSYLQSLEKLQNVYDFRLETLEKYKNQAKQLQKEINDILATVSEPVKRSDETNNSKHLSSYSEDFDALTKPQDNLESFSSIVTENLKEQEVKIEVVPNVASPQEFANDVTVQLKGVKAEINVTPKITDKDISKLIGKQKKSNPTVTDSPKLNANDLIDKYNLKRKDIDTGIVTKVKELCKDINSLTTDVIETNSDNAWEALVQHIKELGNVLNSFGKIKLDNAQFESVLKVAEQLKGTRVFIDDNIKNDILSGASVDNLRQLNNEFINLGVTFTTTKEQATNLDSVWDEFIQETNRFDLSNISTGAERITAVIEELREAKQVLYGEKGYVSAENYGNNEMLTYVEEIEKAQQKQAKANPDQSALYQKTIDAIRREKQALTELASEVSNVTTSVDDKTNAFREEEQVVTGTVQREIGELERLAGQLRSVQDDIGKIATTITSLPKIDFDVDLSKLNIENIDGASIASFNAFREQLAGLEAQLNVSNLSSKLVEISNAFATLSGLKLDNLNTKNLNLTRITNLTKKSEDINTLVDTLDALGECLERLKNDGSFDKEYFAGLKFSAKNVNNMADMAVALETVGIALRQFDKEAKDALSSINKLAENAEGLKNLSSIIKAPKKVKKVQEAIENEDKPKEPTVAQTNKATTIDNGIINGTYQKEVDKLTKRYERLNGIIEQADDRTGDLKTALGTLQKANSVEEKIEAFENFKNIITLVKNELETLETDNAGNLFAQDIAEQLRNIQEQYKNLSYLSDSLTVLKTKIGNISNEAKNGTADLTKLGKQAKEAFANFQKGILPSGVQTGGFNSYEDAIAKARELVNSYTKVKSELKVPLQLNDNGIAKMTAQVIDLNGQLKNLTFVYNDASKAMSQQMVDVKKELTGLSGAIDAVKNKFKDMAVYWTATLFDPHDIMSNLGQVAGVVIDLNTKMTELAKVSGLSIGQLEEHFDGWANTAKDLGATVSDTISATADWSRLGYSVEEAEKLAEVAILYKNVGDGIDIEAANESLVSTMQGFQLEANQAESVIDSFNEVSNNFAISSAGIGEALQRSASSFYAANTDLNSAIALITATRLKNWLNIWKHILRIYLIAIEVFITMHHNIEETTI